MPLNREKIREWRRGLAASKRALDSQPGWRANVGLWRYTFRHQLKLVLAVVVVGVILVIAAVWAKHEFARETAEIDRDLQKQARGPMIGISIDGVGVAPRVVYRYEDQVIERRNVALPSTVLHRGDGDTAEVEVTNGPSGVIGCRLRVDGREVDSQTTDRPGAVIRCATRSRATTSSGAPPSIAVR